MIAKPMFALASLLVAACATTPPAGGPSVKVTPLGSHRLEMHVRTGRGLHASCKRDLDRPATYSLEVVQLDPGTGTWLLDKPPLMPAQTYRTPDEWEARIAQARATFGKD